MSSESKKTGNSFINIQIDSFYSDKSDTSVISYLKANISGYDIFEGKESESDFISYNPHNPLIDISDAPEGIDRIITVKAYDKNKKELPEFQVRAVIPLIKKGENAVIVSKETTAFASVLYGIKNIYDFNELEKDGRMDTIRKVISTDLHPSLFNSTKLIGELQGFSFPYSTSKEDYILKAASFSFDYFLENLFNVKINDPLSKELKNQKAGREITISNIAPGNWTLSITDEKGNLLDSSDIQVTSGKKSETGHLEHKGIVLLISDKEFKDYSLWPEYEIKKQICLDNSENYSLYDFKDRESVTFNLQDKKNNNFFNEGLEISSYGVYILEKNGLKSIISSTNASPLPEKPSENEFKKCFKDDPDNKRFFILFSENLYGSKVNSVKALFNKGINDHDGYYYGKHYSLTKSSDGYWYCAVPYKDLLQTNQCGQPSYNFKVNDKIINPPDFVPDGFIYQKFNGSSGCNKFLVLIYSSQSEKFMTAKLSAAKKCKELKDFNLNSICDQQKLANFRLIPKTKKLYRSYHPYQDDKTGISDTSKARMEYVTKLAEKANIRADINLSDTAQVNATYFMPEYYKKIIENKKVLYMTDCGYSVCYEQSNSKTFANGIKKIVEFINTNEGPYLIHCAIGTDRTGVTGAVIAGLCGASLKEIENDYCASTEMGIYEYRGPGAVRYALQNLLGVSDIQEVQNLQKSLQEYFIKGGYLTQIQIDKMISQLN